VVDLLLLDRSQLQAAQHLELNWHQVHAVQAAAVQRVLARRDTEKNARVGLDEKNFGRGHHYGTVLTNLEYRRVPDGVERRRQASAQRALRALLEEQRARIKLVTRGVWPAFLGAASLIVQKPDLVHDRFHLMKHLNEGGDKIRKQERAELTDSARDWPTGRKYLFLKHPADWKAEEKQCFQELHRKDLKVTKALGQRATLQSLWMLTSKTAAHAFFDQWLQKAKATALRPINQVAVMLQDHLPDLLNYITHRVTNAVTEGFNSKIQMIKSCVRGFRSFENYHVAILFHCGKPQLYPK
jgi:transposase